MSGAAAPWRVNATFLVRRAGFAFSLLDVARCARSAALGQAADAARELAEHARRELLTQRFPVAVTAARERGDAVELRALSKARRAVGRGLPRALPEALATSAIRADHERWLARRERASQLRDELGDAIDEERRDVAAQMRRVAHRPDVLEALFTLAPSFSDALERGHGSSDAGRRAFDRRLYAFLQRLAAKNETTSFFGPVTLGSFSDIDEPRSGPEAPRGCTERRGFASFWAVVELARAATRTAAVREDVAARRLPVAELRNGHAVLPGRPPLALEGDDERILRACDGRRRSRDVALDLGLDATLVEGRIRRLERAAIVQRRCEPSSTTADPLSDLLRQLPQLPELEPLRDGAEQLGELVSEYARSGLPERRHALHAAEKVFESLTGRAASRDPGGTYADRSILFDDCRGDTQPFLLPDAWARRLERELEAVLDFGLALGSLTREAHRRLAARVLREASAPLSYGAFAQLLAERVEAGELEPLLTEPRALVARLNELVRDRAADGVARLDAGELGSLAAAPAVAAFVSPDILLGGRDAEIAVLGEVHPYVFAWGLQGEFADDSLAQETETLLAVWGGRARLATVLHRRRHKGLVSDRFPGLFIEVTGSAGINGRAAIAELTVTLEDDEPVLLGPGGPLTLYVGEEDHPHLRTFAPPQVELPRLRLGAATPRVVVGDLVVQRRRWDLTTDDRAGLAGEDADLVLAVCGLRRRLGLPRHVFASSPAELKPFLVDLDSIFAVEHLRRLAGLGPVALVEMLPAPDDLWLTRDAGQFTSELRLAMARGA